MSQGSPYQAVTGKIYRLLEHLLLPANAQKSLVFCRTSNINQMLYRFEKVPYQLCWKLGRTLMSEKERSLNLLRLFPARKPQRIWRSATSGNEIVKNYGFHSRKDKDEGLKNIAEISLHPIVSIFAI